jgi:hypothetical protein
VGDVTYAVVGHAGQIAVREELSRGLSPSLVCGVFADTVPFTKM